MQRERQVVRVIERLGGEAELCVIDQWLLRLPQEDFCQVHAVPPEKKYESDGGPGLEELATILRQSQTPEEDMATLLKAQLLFWMLRAIDGHAKNFSIALLPNNGFHLTPLYDVLSAWPAVGDGPNQWTRHELKLAMAVRGSSGKHYKCAQIMRRHFNQTARKLGHAADMEPLIEETLSQVDPAIEIVSSLLPPGFSERVSQSIFDGLRESAKQLAD
ncbi:MAG: HipA domain-containing protein [Hydrogenophaga sp.]|nr:HipA domain-containing protein [Hydrogenophaga sp.]